MRNRVVLALIISPLVFACGTEEKADLQAQVDSLRVELETSQRMAKTLQEVGVLMDSIDQNRQLLRVNMVEGTTYDDYSARMSDLNDYVKQTEKKIEDLEAALKKSKGAASGFASTIKKLKADLQNKSDEIAQLQEQVEKYRNENQNLISTIDLQMAEIGEKDIEIQAKEQELALIEARIQELMIQSKLSEADAYFARAEATEEAANRTKLAPKKKKETLKEALELYRKALSLGHPKAQARISDLEKKL
jgi:chromosome segregation ATPase